jgi:hypothetical protein
MKILTLGAIALIGAGLTGGQAFAFNFGSVTLKPGETRTVDFSTSARTMRVCNDFFSSGAIVATIGGSLPHDLSPGVCAEEIGDRMTIQSLASGLATVEFRSLSDVPGSRQIDE